MLARLASWGYARHAVPQISSIGKGQRSLTTITDLVSRSPEQVAVIYGTHSGNTQKYAQYLRSELKTRFRVQSVLEDIKEVDFTGSQNLKSKDTLIFLVSTYGEGEPNDATKPFAQYIQQAEDANLTFAFHYSIMSRGNSLYDHTFAQAGVDIDAQLTKLGAKALTPVGIQDKISHRSDDEYFHWKESLFAELKRHYNWTEQEFSYEPIEGVREIRRSSGETLRDPEPMYYRLDSRAQLTDIKTKILMETDRKYVHADVKLPEYHTGDYVVLWPQNSEVQIDKFLLAVFGNAEADERRHDVIELPSGQTTTYEMLARHFLDINGVPDREFLYKISHFAPTPEAADRALQLVTTTNIPQLGLAELLHDLSPNVPWITNLSASAFLEILPKLEPRRYSISSSHSESPSWASLTCVVEQDHDTGFLGVATGNLLSFTEGGQPTQQIMAVDEPLLSFRLPADPLAPLLLFGVGTGAAPFRGFVRERYFQHCQGIKQGPIVLFTGSRTERDLVHYEEFKEMAADPSFDFKFVPAFSRVDRSHTQRGYLVDNIPRNDELIWENMQKGGHIYICGDVRKVRSAVRKSILTILVNRMGLPLDERKPVWKKLTKEGRTHLELW